MTVPSEDCSLPLPPRTLLSRVPPFRREAAESREALAARMTVMEGRVRFLECEVDACVRRGEYRPEQQQQQRGEAGLGERSPEGEVGAGRGSTGEGGGVAR